jgi:PleD family two-component response regulator
LAAEPPVFNTRRLAISASFGVTAWFPGIPAVAEKLAQVAENALSMAKNQGRDRVVVLPPQ